MTVPVESQLKIELTFYNPNKKDMHEIFDCYLGSISKEEEENIKKTLKSQRYSRLEINLVHPYSHVIK